MNFLYSMLGAYDAKFSWTGVLDTVGGKTGTYGWVYDLMSVLSTVLWVLLALVGAAGGIYALYVGIKMARADSAEQRDENKKRLINIIVSIVVVVVLILFFNTFLPAILQALGVFKDPTKTEGGSIKMLIDTTKTFLHM